MSDTFNRVEETALIADYKEMASYILEIESIFLFLNRRSSLKYFQFCFVVKDLELGEDERVIEEKIKNAKKKIDDFKLKFDVFEETIMKEKKDCEDELQRMEQVVCIKFDELISENSALNKEIQEKLKKS